MKKSAYFIIAGLIHLTACTMGDREVSSSTATVPGLTHSW